MNANTQNANAAPVYVALQAYLSEPHLNRSEPLPSTDKKWGETRLFLIDLIKFLVEFPRTGLWYSDTALTAQTALEIFVKALSAVDRVYRGTDGQEREWVFNLLIFVGTMEDWLRRDPGLATVTDSPNPALLRNQALDVVSLILRSLANDCSIDTVDSQETWLVAKGIVFECIGAIEDILGASSDETFAGCKVFLSRSPRLSEFDAFDNSDIVSTFDILQAWQSPACLASLLQVVLTDIRSRSFGDQLSYDIARKQEQALSKVFEYCTTLPYKSEGTKIEVLTRLVRLLPFSDRPLFPSISECHALRLFSWRVTDGPEETWAEFDRTLAAALSKMSFNLYPSASVMLAIELLKAQGEHEQLESLLDLSYTLLSRVLDRMPLSSLRNLKTLLVDRIDIRSSSLLGAVDMRISFLDLDINPAEDAGRKRKRTSNPDVRTAVELELSKLFYGEPGHLVADRINMEHDDWVQAMIDQIMTACAECPPSASAIIDRLPVLEKLPCEILHPGRVQCSEQELDAAGHPNFIPIAISLAVILLDGGLPMRASRAPYRLLTRFIRHSTASRRDLKSLLRMIGPALASEDRAVRLEAGKALEALARSLVTGPGPVPASGLVLAPILQTLQDVFQRGSPRVKETSLVTFGLLGSVPSSDVQGPAILELVAQLGSSTSLVQALAYSQLVALARLHDNRPYALISPHLSLISQFAVDRITSDPTPLNELCRFLGRSVLDFLTITQSYTLPFLVGRRNRAALVSVAKTLDKTVPAMLVPFASKILAYTLMLDTDNDSQTTLNFLVQQLIESSSNAITLEMLLTSYNIEVLSELIIEMANEAKKSKVQTALERLQRGFGRGTSMTLPQFLQPHTLGILAHLNTALISSKGKASVEGKRQIIRSLELLISTVGPSINNIAPQIVALLQGLIATAELASSALQTWDTFARTLNTTDFVPHVGPTTAAIVSNWNSFAPEARKLAKETINYIVFVIATRKKSILSEVVSLSDIPELTDAHQAVMGAKEHKDADRRLRPLLHRSQSENPAISHQSLRELKAFMTAHATYFQNLASGAMFHPYIGDVIKVLYSCASRDGEEFDDSRLVALECIGVLGALDPDRFDLSADEATMTITYNFAVEQEVISFAIHLISGVLAGAYRGASDITYQTNLAYAIQELLRLCGFTASLIQGSGPSVPDAVQKNWDSLPKHVVETVAALLDGRLTLDKKAMEPIPTPIYPTVATYREWIQRWTRNLISRVHDEQAASIFHVFRSVVRHQDVSIARHLLPHLILHLIISGTDDDRDGIRNEIVLVLKDQVSPNSSNSADRRHLSAQTIFMLMDHVSQWLRAARQVTQSRSKSRNPVVQLLAEQIIGVESLISSIDLDLMANAAFENKAFARALMNFEQVISLKRERNAPEDSLQPYYEKLHQTYANLDEPDGMQGISNFVLSPSLEHQIREHESTGRWTAAQSCWEIKLQNSPQDIELHLGLIRCLRNLGHYDTLETHIRGVISQNPFWAASLSGFRAEGAWMVGDWNGVEEAVRTSTTDTPEISVARVLLALRNGNAEEISQALPAAQKSLGAPIVAAGRQSYRRLYDVAVHLHVLRDLEMVHQTSQLIFSYRINNRATKVDRSFMALKASLAARLEATLPSFRTREPILSLHRIALGLMLPELEASKREISRGWLETAKLARKAMHSQTAYSAVLQAREIGDPFSFIQSCKLIKTDGEDYRALQALESAIARMPPLDGPHEAENTWMMAKALLLRARWRKQMERCSQKEIVQSFKDAFTTLKEWESPYFYVGSYYDELRGQTTSRGQYGSYLLNTCKYFVQALSYGSKYIYQTMPRLLTLWLDLAAEPEIIAAEKAGHPPRTSNSAAGGEDLRSVAMKILLVIQNALRTIPSYQWYTAFPQIVSRIEHPSKSAYETLANIIISVISAYTPQALWVFTGAVHSRRLERKQRASDIITRIAGVPGSNESGSVGQLANQWVKITKALLLVCDAAVGDESVALLKDLSPKLQEYAPCRLVLPQQNAMTVALPPTSAKEDNYHPFPTNLPTIHGFVEEVELMKSLVRPRKLGVIGSNGLTYYFLCKPKDDLRKDARLMDFNAIINKLLRTNSESRRRRLSIRTYSVVPLNEECGFIEWVPNTTGLRHILDKFYSQKGISTFAKDVTDAYNKARESGEAIAAQHFVTRTLPRYPSVFHEWFMATFAEPTAWFNARLTYSRTAAVISIVGHILGLGDRHGENILFDTTTGDTVHVDLNCLFEKGKTFGVPERVPFRLTNNMVAGMGVTGVEGPFRIACEVTMQVLRDNGGSLMSVLEAFIHDPLVEWEAETRKEERSKTKTKRRADNQPEVSVEHMRTVSQKFLVPIHQKVRGIQVTENPRTEKEIAIPNQVDMLIKEATDPVNLSMMYFGWASWL